MSTLRSKQTSSRHYNQQYFSSISSSSPDFSKKINRSQFQTKYKQIGRLLKLKTKDTIIDYGCGPGDLSFYLYLKYHCQVIGIDRSAPAINICRQKLEQLNLQLKQTPKIRFINHNNQNLPEFKNIKVVYFIDVLEHLYDSEIKTVLDQIPKWNHKSAPLIVIHTDNNLYLKYISWVFHLFSILTGKQKLTNLINDLQKNKQLHINLTTPKKLKQKMTNFGFKQIKLLYSPPTLNTITAQLGLKNKILAATLKIILQKVKSLSPGFYAVYQSIN